MSIKQQSCVEAMKQALEALEQLTWAVSHPDNVKIGKDGQAALRQAIAVYESAPPECQTEAEKTAFAFGWWKAMEELKRNKNYD